MNYLESGEHVRVLVAFSSGFVVERMFDDEDGEPYFGSPEIVRSVFDKPPSSRIEKSMAECEAKLVSAKKELESIRAETKALLDEQKRVRSSAAQNAAIKRVVDFLEVGITHVVTFSYGDVRVSEMQNMKCRASSGWDRDVRLLSLFGKSEGDLAWKINEYRDGSGSWLECFPHASVESATAEAKRIITGLFADHEYAWIDSVIKSAVAIGIEVPADALARSKEKKVKDLRAQLAEHNGRAEKAAAEISKLTNDA